MEMIKKLRLWVLIGEESKEKAGLGWSVKALRFLYTSFLAPNSVFGDKGGLLLIPPEVGSTPFTEEAYFLLSGRQRGRPQSHS